MRRFLLIATAALTFSFISHPNANAAQNIIITEPTHRYTDGLFIDDLLAQKLLPTGELGLLVFPFKAGVRSWQVDPATLAEIVDMSDGYEIKDLVPPTGVEVAKAWLDQFRKVTKNEKVSAIIYANPSTYWAEQIIGEQQAYLSATGKLGAELIIAKPTSEVVRLNNKKQSFSDQEVNFFKYAQRQINLMASVVDQRELIFYQNRLAQLLNPEIDKKIIPVLIKDFDQSIVALRNKLKISKSKFTITSSKEEIPITVVNNFNAPVNLKLSFRTLNPKVVISEAEQITIEANSKKQVLLGVQVLATGESVLLAQLTNLKNKPVGYPVNIPLKLAVISPVATWITSGAAILLFIAAIGQSIRRVRRSK